MTESTRQHIQQLLTFLSDPANYPHCPESVEIVQTHASIVALVPPYVFKVKKPVDFGFLDFSTLEKRRYYCQQEVQLNRQLCSGLYVGVLPLVERQQQWYWGGEGTVVDYAVVMHYLSPENFAHCRLQQRQLSLWHIKLIAKRLVQFYSQQSVQVAIQQWGTLDNIRTSTDENIEQIRPFVGSIIPSVTYRLLTLYTHRWYQEGKALLEQRRQQGWIRDCHGDLRLEHIYLHDDAICLYDRIEFNPRLRFIDVASDIAFLAMDLLYYQMPRYAQRFVEQMQQDLKDPNLYRILPFYLVYRAWVRAKVECFRSVEPEINRHSQQESQIKALRFMRIALRAALFGTAPVVVIVMGKIGSGKTTFAQIIAQHLGWNYLSTDQIRKEMRGLPLHELPPSEVRTVIYHRSVSRLVYRQLFARAVTAIRCENGVVIEGTFSQRRFRHEARRFFTRHGIVPVFLYLYADDQSIRQRLKQREGKPSISDARLPEYEQLTPFFEEPDQSETSDVIWISTDQDPIVAFEQCSVQLMDRQFEALRK